MKFNKRKIVGGAQLGIRCECGRVLHVESECDSCHTEEFEKATAYIETAEEESGKTLDLTEIVNLGLDGIRFQGGVAC